MAELASAQVPDNIDTDNIDNCIAFCKRFSDSENVVQIVQDAVEYECVGPLGRTNALMCGRGEPVGPEWQQSDMRWLHRPEEKIFSLEQVLTQAGFSRDAIEIYIRTIRDR